MSRGTAELLWARTVDLVLSASQGQYCRGDLAARWGCTPRNVSNVVASAARMYGVRVRSGPPSTRWAYHLESPGVLSMPALARLPRMRTCP